MERKWKSKRRSKKSTDTARGWIYTRKINQFLTLAVCLLLILGLQGLKIPFPLAKLPILLDPLAILTNLLASRMFLTSSLLALITISLTIVFGRAWCGWVCPLGTILDLLTPARTDNERFSMVPPSWRVAKFLLLIMILILALLGNQTLMIFDPVTIFIRTFTIGIFPALDRVITAIEAYLYGFPSFGEIITEVDTWFRPRIFPVEPEQYPYGWLFILILVGLIAMNWIAPRFFCRYLCPLGGFLALISKGALLRRRVETDCKSCGRCNEVCPTGTIDPMNGFVSDPSECTMCLECLNACPRDSINFRMPRSISQIYSLADWNEYDPGRREALFAIGGALAAIILFRIQPLFTQENPFLLLPPGAQGNDFQSACIRCGLCMRVCPTGGLQPAISEAGIAGLWTPVLVPRLGYCDYACNNCGLVCPVHAIPSLVLEQKRKQTIGIAEIDQERCIAWADHLDCIVCEEMCPVPDKAIRLEEVSVTNAEGRVVLLKLPHMIRKNCIGCGICEYQCPVEGAAAIRVLASHLVTI